MPLTHQYDATSLTTMPREFIPNVDDANAELVRVDALLATAEAEATQLRATHTQALSDLKVAHATEVAKAIADAKALSDAAILTANTNHAKEMAAETAKTAKLLAQANLDSKPIETADSPQSSGLTGLQRAIAANTASQKTHA
jgi:hypothetical protein